jgi:exonuclease III
MTIFTAAYIEAAVDGLLIGCLYVPNGNPVKSETFSIKLRWFERLIAHAGELLATGAAGRARRRLQRDADRTRRL